MVGALAVGVLLVIRALFLSGGDYTVTAVLDNAGQLVEGNEVRVGSIHAGTISKIRLSDSYQAEVEIEMEPRFSPLHDGTELSVGVPGLAGIAGRFITLVPGPDNGPEIPDGGQIGVEHTTAPVDVDQLLSALDPRTVSVLRDLLQHSAEGLDGQGSELNQALLVLNPAVSQTTATIDEVVRDQVSLRRLLHDSASIVGTLGHHRREIAAATAATAAATGAIASQREALADAISLTPPTLREANTAFVNLRAAFADVRPAIDEARPVARRLSALLPRLQPLARRLRIEAPPLRSLIRGPLRSLLARLPALSRNGTPVVSRLNVAVRRLLPAVNQLRPYAPEVTSGLIGGIGGNVTGYYDANGQYARIAFVGGPFTATTLPPPSGGPSRNGLVDRCPGGAIYPAADRSNPYTDGGRVDCDPSLAGSGP